MDKDTRDMLCAHNRHPMVLLRGHHVFLSHQKSPELRSSVQSRGCPAGDSKWTLAHLRGIPPALLLHLIPPCRTWVVDHARPEASNMCGPSLQTQTNSFRPTSSPVLTRHACPCRRWLPCHAMPCHAMRCDAMLHAPCSVLLDSIRSPWVDPSCAGVKAVSHMRGLVSVLPLLPLYLP
ncbi:hypothetical protein LX32DRAFT_191201 [Colletotrichum zoysiae]|uniref:Uncharacterized protein n=1 Tax=Colletotrichum zoysiae TaxID=1216348 RepID=A0AAD9LVX0_9PEZI|nr:hypothetical protein LX32DRAFT_191201 [Colletotrichum zoysiae]